VVGVALARAHENPVGAFADALDGRDRTLECLHDLGHRDLVGRAGEQVTPARSAPALDEPGLAQPGHEVLEVGEREPIGLGDVGERNGGVPVSLPELHHHADSVLGLRGEHHPDKS